MSDPAVVSDPRRLQELGRERRRLEPLLQASQAVDRLRAELLQVRELLASPDADLRDLARAELADLEPGLQRAERELDELLVPRDPLDDKNAMLEIRAGTGGDEAGLFAADLLRMYRRFIERRGWKAELLSLAEAGAGGIREAVLQVSGEGAYGTLKHESGVHRVQRVPATEQQGRIHTSAATVAVLPEAEEVDVEVRPDEIKVDVFRSSGPGGQSVNTTDSAVRITHLPTGLVVQCQDEKSQLKNKTKALRVLRARLLDRRIAELESERARERKTQVGTGDRSAKIRTYNFPQSRVTDHRIQLTLHRLAQVLDGELDELTGALRAAARSERLT
ncbi:MAG: peptide chain release factor 1 [Gemmatimonadetes bacterium]|nr:peptide chain release factor 1 [Gemmatimonadota bacterium]